MAKKILECIDEWFALINEYNYLDEIIDITSKILKLKSVLNDGKEKEIASVTKKIFDNTDFEGIEIKFRKPNRVSYIVIRNDAVYLIDRLSLLAFKKIAEHELEQSIEQFGKESSVVYKALELALALRRKNNN